MAAGLKEPPGAGADQVQELPGLGVAQGLRHQLAAPAGVDQVVEADAWDFVLFHQVEDGGHFLVVEAADGEPEAHLESCLLAVAHPGHGRGEGTLLAPELIVDGLGAVQADAHVRKAQVLEAPGQAPVYEGAVGGDHGPHPVGHGPGHQVKEIRPHQGLAAGEQHHRHAEILQIPEQGQAFIKAEFIGGPGGGGLGVAMEALEVAPFGDVPDHHRLLVGGELQEVGRQVLGPAAAVAKHIAGLHRAAIKLGNSHHV